MDTLTSLYIAPKVQKALLSFKIYQQKQKQSLKEAVIAGSIDRIIQDPTKYRDEKLTVIALAYSLSAETLTSTTSTSSGIALLQDEKALLYTIELEL